MKKIIIVFFLLFSALSSKNLFAATFDVVNDQVYVSGETIGLKVNTGVMVTKFYSIQDNEVILKPWENSNLQIGDVITKVNGISVDNSDDLLLEVQKNGINTLNLEISRNYSVINTTITPVINDDALTLGIYVKDHILGVGTMTFITADGMKFASLGHQIGTNYDSSGSIYKAVVVGIDKSYSGYAGSKKASIDSFVLGDIYSNNNKGVYGEYSSSTSDLDLYNIKTKEQINLGSATIMTCIESDVVKEYDIEITNVYLETTDDIKGIKFKITDEDLLAKTGGVIQGMSGSPIIQDGKVIGAVTHVIINTPNYGYGIFVENMLTELDYSLKY